MKGGEKFPRRARTVTEVERDAEGDEEDRADRHDLESLVRARDRAARHVTEHPVVDAQHLAGRGRSLSADAVRKTAPSAIAAWTRCGSGVS